MTLGRDHRVRAALALLVSAILVLAGVPAVQAAGDWVSVIVSRDSAAGAAAAVRSVGGEVTSGLPVADGVLARVPAAAMRSLSRRAIVVADRPIRWQSDSFGGSLVSAYPSEVGATSLWRRGVTGEGVTVALVDTGVADVADLGDRVVARADLTSEGDNKDNYGHGTFMAGLIAGDGTSSGGRYIGVAPEADLMAIKVAGRDGSTTLGKVLVGIQIVDTYRNQFDVGVLLLAVDSGSPLPPELDPLSRALRRVWKHGVTVVVPAGNGGPGEGSIATPGEDPVLLTAGSVNDMGTPGVLDDEVSSFTGVGPTRWHDLKPDVAAPGEHLVSLRSVGSTIDEDNPSAVVETGYFKGTGTSMSAAVTAGAAALVLSRSDDLDADGVKAVLMGSANPIPAGQASTVGAGIVNASDALALEGPGDLPAAPEDPDAEHGNDPEGKVWKKNGKGYTFDARQWASDAETAARSWAARQWARESFEARQWAARQWAARSWAARSWAARAWDARSWDARSWDARSWDARSWDARSWAARQWTARQWTARSWEARSWDARSWDARSWDARSWDARSWDARSWEARSWEARSWEARSWEARSWEARGWE